MTTSAHHRSQCDSHCSALNSFLKTIIKQTTHHANNAAWLLNCWNMLSMNQSQQPTRDVNDQTSASWWLSDELIQNCTANYVKLQLVMSWFPALKNSVWFQSVFCEKKLYARCWFRFLKIVQKSSSFQHFCQKQYNFTKVQKTNKRNHAKINSAQFITFLQY